MEKSKTLDDSDVGEAPLRLDANSGTTVLMPRDESLGVAGGASVAVASGAGKPSKDSFSKLGIAEALAVCGAGNARFRPGQSALRKRVDATVKQSFFMNLPYSASSPR